MPAETAGLGVRAGDGGDGDGTADYGKASATAIISFFMCVLPR
jgi:hypothetical protein